MPRRCPLALSFGLHVGIAATLLAGYPVEATQGLDGVRSFSIYKVRASLGTGASDSACSGPVELVHTTTLFQPLPPLAALEGSDATSDLRLVCVRVDPDGRVGAIFEPSVRSGISARRLRAFADKLRFHPGGGTTWLPVLFDEATPPDPAPIA